MRILLVEDEHQIAQSIKKGLIQEYFAVDLAFDGQQGLDLASSETYDIIILDLMLPKINGLQICRQLRSQNIHTPILILTAKVEVEDRVNGLNCGADDYLSKPFAFRELLARIKALSRRPAVAQPSILKIADLTFNTLTYQVKRSSRLLSFSKTEFALLQFLLRHQDQVLSKEQITNHVWNYDADILPNTVEVYIGYLRNKLGSPPLIHTVRGFGYKLSAK